MLLKSTQTNVLYLLMPGQDWARLGPVLVADADEMSGIYALDRVRKCLLEITRQREVICMADSCNSNPVVGQCTSITMTVVGCVSVNVKTDAIGNVMKARWG